MVNLIKRISDDTYVLDPSIYKSPTKLQGKTSQFKTKITQDAINRKSTDEEHKWNTQNLKAYLYSYKKAIFCSYKELRSKSSSYLYKYFPHFEI